MKHAQSSPPRQPPSLPHEYSHVGCWKCIAQVQWLLQEIESQLNVAKGKAANYSYIAEAYSTTAYIGIYQYYTGSGEGVDTGPPGGGSSGSLPGGRRRGQTAPATGPLSRTGRCHSAAPQPLAPSDSQVPGRHTEEGVRKGLNLLSG